MRGSMRKWTGKRVRGTQKGGQMQKLSVGASESDNRDRKKNEETHIHTEKQTERDGGKIERGYYGKEVKLAVMLCLVEKKTGFVCVGQSVCPCNLPLCVCACE